MNNDVKLRTAIDAMHSSNMRVDSLHAQLDTAEQVVIDAKQEVIRVLASLGWEEVDVIYGGRVYRSQRPPGGLSVKDFTGRILPGKG